MVTSDPTLITTVSAVGIHIERDGAPHLVPWDAVEMIVASTVTQDGERIFTLGIEHEDERFLLAFEQQAIWRELVKMLPDGLPGIMPFESWSMILTEGSGAPITIYQRGDYHLDLN